MAKQGTADVKPVDADAHWPVFRFVFPVPCFSIPRFPVRHFPFSSRAQIRPVARMAADPQVWLMTIR